jgi:hypothetical protein
MPFDRDLQLALDPTASEQLPRELHLGQYAYSWTNGKLEYKSLTRGFRKLRAEELRQLMRRLQAAPQYHVILLNLGGHHMGDDMMRELAEPIAALKVSHSADNTIGPSSCTTLAGALPHLSALQELDLESNYFRYFSLYFAA